MPPLSSQLLNNRYQIQSLLGQGGMGSVYRATDTVMNRTVAIKERTPDPNATPEGLAEARAQFQREAQILGALSHPNLAHVYDFFSANGNEYVVMEFIEGQNLQEAVNKYGAINEGAVRAWADQILEALIYIHERNIIHRDVKPANIILNSEGRVLLVDFGLVKLIDPNDPRTATVLRGMGTAEYAPLEQFSPGMHTDARSDIYSLGATLYHLLAGRPPLDVPRRLLDPDQQPTIHALSPKVSEQMEAVVQKAMEIQPRARWQSAKEMKQALVRQTHPATQPPVMVQPATAPSLVAAPTPTPSGQPFVSMVAAASGPRIWVPLGIIGAIVLAILLVTGPGLLAPRVQPTAAPPTPLHAAGSVQPTSTAVPRTPTRIVIPNTATRGAPPSLTVVVVAENTETPTSPPTDTPPPTATATQPPPTLAFGTFINKWIAAPTPFSGITEIVSDHQGELYVADEGAAPRIVKFDQAGDLLQEITGNFIDPSSVALDPSGNIYVADAKNNCVFKYDKTGELLATFGGSGDGQIQLDLPEGLAIGQNGNIYISDADHDEIQVIDPNGQLLHKWGSQGDQSGQFLGTGGIAVNTNGVVYVADSGNNRIQKFDVNGNFISAWGQKGTGIGEFAYPSTITLDSGGNLYVTDSQNYRVQKFDGDGNFLGMWGSKGNAEGQFAYPNGIAAEDGYVFVGDATLHRIQVFWGGQ